MLGKKGPGDIAPKGFVQEPKRAPPPSPPLLLPPPLPTPCTPPPSPGAPDEPWTPGKHHCLSDRSASLS